MARWINRSPFGAADTHWPKAFEFSKQERQVLMRAAEIAEKARALVERESDLDYELARLEHAAREFAS
jgi:hypothetical protein